MPTEAIPHRLRRAVEGLPREIEQESVLKTVASELVSELGDGCVAAFVAGEGERLETAVTAGTWPRRQGTARFNEALWAHVIDTRRSLCLPAPDLEALTPELSVGFDDTPLVIAPIFARGLAVGVIAVARKSGRPAYSGRERKLVHEVASWIGSAFDLDRPRAAATARVRLARARAEQARDHGDDHRFHEVFAQARTPMALTTLEGTVVRANAALGALLDRPCEELEGAIITELAVAGDRDLVSAILGLLRAGALSIARFEARFWTASGWVVSSMLTSSLIRSDEGRSLYFFHQVEDLTDRKRVEAAIAAREAEMTILFDRSSVGAAAIDRGGGIRRVNPAFAALAGRTPAALRGMRLAELCHPGEAARLQEAIERVAGAETRHERIEHRFVRPDGTTLWGLVNLAHAHAAGDEEAVTIVQVVDVTEARRASAERDALVKAFESAGDGIAALDRDGRLVRVNRPFAALLARTPEELVGTDWTETVVPADRRALAAAMERARAGGRQVLQVWALPVGRPSRAIELTLVAGGADPDVAYYCFTREVSKALAEAVAPPRMVAGEASR